MTQQAGESAAQPKYGRGENPRSLANLKEPWTSETKPTPPNATRDPIIKPAMRRLATMTLEEFRELRERIQAGRCEDISVADGIAFTWLEKALTDKPWGDKARADAATKIDGDDKGDTYNIDKAVLVRYIEGPQ